MAEELYHEWCRIPLLHLILAVAETLLKRHQTPDNIAHLMCQHTLGCLTHLVGLLVMQG